MSSIWVAVLTTCQSHVVPAPPDSPTQAPICQETSHTQHLQSQPPPSLLRTAVICHPHASHQHPSFTPQQDERVSERFEESVDGRFHRLAGLGIEVCDERNSVEWSHLRQRSIKARPAKVLPAPFLLYLSPRPGESKPSQPAISWGSPTSSVRYVVVSFDLLPNWVSKEPFNQR
jgi:hypothetical protein